MHIVLYHPFPILLFMSGHHLTLTTKEYKMTKNDMKECNCKTCQNVNNAKNDKKSDMNKKKCDK